MAITQSQSKQPADVTNIVIGSYLDSAGTPEAMTITLGFTPRYVIVVNQTDATKVEKFEGMADAVTVKTAQNGAITAGADSAIIFSSTGFVYLKALTIQNKQYSWVAIG
jgi:hypothetical protein